jgi:hypothetical protein
VLFECSSCRWRNLPSTSVSFRSIVWVLTTATSSRFLVSIGRDAEAVAVIHRVAAVNGKTCTLTVEDLHNAAKPYYKDDGDGAQVTTKFSTWGLVKNSFRDLVSPGVESNAEETGHLLTFFPSSFPNTPYSQDGEHIRGLFATPRLAYSCSLIIFIYGSLGLAYPLFNGFLGAYLSLRQAGIGNNSVDATYCE